ncbi:hypothetical protein [Burkholderia sp. BCC1985]|uniref:head-tail joining protein n=1 Tax=Burkholderia sp. BCC1985 TaxID=2817442 RepID=UPI002AB0A79F|nr:hypothetical protein [Burkholderia sp. BCC1985]
MPINWDALVIGPLQGVFGEQVTYLPATGGSFEIRGVYDKAYFAVNVETGSMVSTSQPTLGIQLSQFPATVQPRQGDQLIVKSTGEQWVVREVHPDGRGGARLMLNVTGQRDV